MIGIISSVITTAAAIYLLTPLGRSSRVERPKFKVIDGKHVYEDLVIAKFPIENRDMDSAFQTLASYFGIGKIPHNNLNLKMQMTAPVLVELDTVTHLPSHLLFILPEKFADIRPTPLDKRVQLENWKAPNHFQVLSLPSCFDEMDMSSAQLTLLVRNNFSNTSSRRIFIARYDDPFVLEPLRTVEFWCKY